MSRIILMDIAAPRPLAKQAPKLLDRMRSEIRVRHFSYRTEQTYFQWVKRFILFHHKRNPAEMSAQELGAYLSHLAEQRQVSGIKGVRSRCLSQNNDS